MSRNLRFIARLRDGVTFDQAAAEMAAIGDALANEYPLTNGGWKVRLVPIRDITGGDGFWVVIALFLFSIGLLIAIATANVSNLIMVRAAARARELAVRTAMGARGGRLLRQFLIEGFVLSALGALLSVPAAWAGLQVIAVVSDGAGVPAAQIDVHELGFVATLALICPLVFSARVGAADRAARSARGARHAGRPRLDGDDARPRRAGGRAGGAGGDPADRVEPRA